MANLLEDIQCVGSDTRPPMLDRTDFASWQQRIRLYCRGKENGVNILKSIDEGPYKLGTFRETLAESTEGTPQLGPERPRVYSDLKSKEKDRGLRDSNYDQLFAYLKQHEAHAKENKMILERLSQPTAQPTADPLALLSNVSNTQHEPFSLKPTINYEHLPMQGTKPQYKTEEWWFRMYRGDPIEGQARLGQARTVKCYNCNGTCHIARNCGPDNPFDDDVDEQPVQDLTLNVDNVFQAEYCDAFDLDVDEAPTAQTMFMANLSSADPITDEAGPSYDSDILSDVQDHDQYLDDTCAYQEEHYVKDNDVPVIHSNASSVQNDTFMMIYNDMCEPSTPSVSNSSRNAVVKNSLTAELATYREQVELYERRAKFELTERE
nr:integrase, catalytic region, zinc finger, CCHC-type, peptidase aspartic, catalytic [Tanacetum cinerariifolium]